jgi:hypothetical protein
MLYVNGHTVLYMYSGVAVRVEEESIFLGFG